MLPVLKWFDSDVDLHCVDALKQHGYSEYRYFIVFPVCDKSLSDMILHDSLCGNMPAIRHCVEEICHCLQHLHNAGRRIHGDVKPSNIMKSQYGNIVLIDMDASAKLNAVCGLRHSSSYLPPEMLTQQTSCQNGKIVTDIVIRNPTNNGSLKGEHLLASYAYDSWSLGILLYQLCSGETLWKTDTQDMLVDMDDMHDLMTWSTTTKSRKLEKIDCIDHHCHNLLSQLLSKDVSKRPDAAHILQHPFIRGGGHLSSLLQSGDQQIIEKAPAQHEINDDIEDTDLILIAEKEEGNVGRLLLKNQDLVMQNQKLLNENMKQSNEIKKLSDELKELREQVSKSCH